jgi:hypothetical protein
MLKIFDLRHTMDKQDWWAPMLLLEFWYGICIAHQPDYSSWG